MKQKHWYDWLWVALVVYTFLSLYNILFAWLGLIFMIAPLVIAIFWGSKAYCNKYCGRGQLYQLLGGRFKASRDVKPPKFLRSRWFRYVFLGFFGLKFGSMFYTSYMAGSSAMQNGEVSLSWLFENPLDLANAGIVSPTIVNFAFGIYGAMLASTVLGLLAMALFKPRTWCVFCPMGTMTQEICRLQHGEEARSAGECQEGCGAIESPCK